MSSLADEEALRIGKALCPCDHAVQNFTLTWHGKFFGRRDLLDRALRRAVAAISAKRWPETAARIERCRRAVSCHAPLAPRITRGLEVLRRMALALDAVPLTRVLGFLEGPAGGGDAEGMDGYLESLGCVWREGPDGPEWVDATDLLDRWRENCRHDAHLYELAERVLKALDGIDYDHEALSPDFERAAAALMEVDGGVQ